MHVVSMWVRDPDVRALFDFILRKWSLVAQAPATRETYAFEPWVTEKFYFVPVENKAGVIKVVKSEIFFHLCHIGAVLLEDAH